MIRVAIADDHEIVRRGLRMTIAGELDMELVGEACCGEDVLALVETAEPDVLVLDLQMPGLDGIETTRVIRARHLPVRILVLTSFECDSRIHAAMQAGVDGYFLKDASGDALVEAIRGTAAGNPQLHPEIARRLMRQMPAPLSPFDTLTEREQEVLRLLTLGMSNKEIAAELILTEQTVKGYVSIILSKLYVSDRTQAALLAVRYGMVALDELPGLGGRN